jgi:hypothetical protein
MNQEIIANVANEIIKKVSKQKYNFSVKVDLSQRQNISSFAKEFFKLKPNVDIKPGHDFIHKQIVLFVKDKSTLSALEKLLKQNKFEYQVGQEDYNWTRIPLIER